jgi:hypothetical protein
MFIASWALIADAECIRDDRPDLSDMVEIMATPSMALSPDLSDEWIARVRTQVEEEAFEGYDEDEDLASMRDAATWRSAGNEHWLFAGTDKVAMLIIHEIEGAS